MPATRDQAICLRQRDWSETSQIVELFTLEHGLIRGLAKGSRRPRSAFDGGLDPFSRGEALAFIKPDRDLITLTAWSIARVYHAPATTLRRWASAALVADVTRALLAPLDPHPELFSALDAALDSAEPLEALRYTRLALAVTGLAPRVPSQLPDGPVLAFHPDTDALRPADNPSQHRPSPQGPAQPGEWLVRRATLELLQSLAAETTPGPARHPPPDDAVIRRAAQFLLALIEHRAGRTPKSGVFFDLTLRIPHPSHAI